MSALAGLVAAAREAAASRRARVPEATVRREAEAVAAGAPGPGRFRGALTRPGMAVIAEIKAASPTAERLREDFEPVELARRCAEAGAAALSVLTEERYFGGELRHLSLVSAAVPLPTLRKDFVVEPYQVYEAVAAGAAAVLLIAEALSPSALRELVKLAREHGLDALVEFHRPELLPVAVEAGSGLIGVNNRNLETLELHPGHSLSLAGELPREAVRVSESGIGNAAQLRLLREAGYDAALVGTALMRAADPGAVLRELVRAA